MASIDSVVALQQAVKTLTEQVSSLQSALADERVERDQMRLKLLEQERSISTLADAVQRQVGLLEHFRAEVDSLKKPNLSSSQNGTLATSTSEDASGLISRSSPHHPNGTDSHEEDSASRRRSRSTRTKLSGAAEAIGSSDSSRDGSRDKTKSSSSPRKSSSQKPERKSSKREKMPVSSRADSGFESDSTPTRVRHRSVNARTTQSSNVEATSIIEPPNSDSKVAMVRSRSQTLHERGASADSPNVKDREREREREAREKARDKEKTKERDREKSLSADSLARRVSSKITVRSPKSKSSAKLTTNSVNDSPDLPRKSSERDVGGVIDIPRQNSKPKVRRPASSTFGVEVMRRNSDKEIESAAVGSTDSPVASPITSPKARATKSSKSSRANKLLEQLTPGEQAATASSVLTAEAPSIPTPEGLLSRSNSSSEENFAFARPQPSSSSTDKILSPNGSRRNSAKELLPRIEPKLEPQNSSEKIKKAHLMESEGAASAADGDEDLNGKTSYGESDASSGTDDNKTKQIIRKVNIFAAGGARAFGVPLSQCQLDERAAVPIVLASLANTLKAEKPTPADLFDKRVDPAKIDALKKRLESATQVISLKEADIYAVAALLKRFFTDLPEPLLSLVHRKSWLQVADVDDDVVRVPGIRSLFHALERVNRKVLEYMVIFFNRLIDNSNNQLSLKQIASIFGPIFLRPLAASPAPAPASSSLLNPRTDAMKRETSSIGPDTSLDADFTPEMLEEKAVTLLAVFMRQYPNIFLLKCPGIEYHKKTFHVRSATVDNFVTLMLDSNYIEREFHDVFWVTYPYFIDSDDLLMRFTDLYHEYNASSRWEGRFRMKILFMLKLWIRRLGSALENDESFKDDFGRFIRDALRIAEANAEDSFEKPMLLSLQTMQFSSAVNQEGLAVVNRIMAGAGAAAGAGAGAASSSTSTPGPSTGRFLRSPSGKRLLNPKGAPIDVLQLDGKAIAFQVTLIDYKLVHMITPNELINGNSMIPHKSPNYSAMVRYINRITHWVALEILSRPTAAERARVLSFFIDVAYYCRKMCNFNGSWAVFGAFGLHPVSRLTQTWERLPRRDASRHKKLSALFEPRLNFSEYRKQMDRALHEGSCVPILAFLPKDIIRFETDPTFTEDRLVDFDKMRGIFSTLQLLSHCQNEAGVPAGKVDDLWDMLLGLPDIEGDELDNLSLKTEPRK